MSASSRAKVPILIRVPPLVAEQLKQLSQETTLSYGGVVQALLNPPEDPDSSMDIADNRVPSEVVARLAHLQHLLILTLEHLALQNFQGKGTTSEPFEQILQNVRQAVQRINAEARTLARGELTSKR